jgi:hypothetical protein
LQDAQIAASQELADGTNFRVPASAMLLLFAAGIALTNRNRILSLNSYPARAVMCDVP